MHDGLSSQFSLTDEASQDSPNFKRPPLQTQHEHARNGHLSEHTPVLQTVQGPTWGAESRQRAGKLTFIIVEMHQNQTYTFSRKKTTIKRTHQTMFFCVVLNGRSKCTRSQPEITVTMHLLLQSHCKSSQKKTQTL